MDGGLRRPALLLATGVALAFASCSRDGIALMYRYHREAWGELEGHQVTLKRSGAAKIELEATGEAPAVSLDRKVPASQVDQLVAALDSAGFFDIPNPCPKRQARGNPPTRSLTVYRHGRARSVDELWACSKSPEALRSILEVLDDFAVGSRDDLSLTPPSGEEARLAMEFERRLKTDALVHLNAFGDPGGDGEALIEVALTRNGLAHATFRKVSPTTQRTYIEAHTVRIDQEDADRLRFKVDRLDAMDLPRTACPGALRAFHLTWPAPKGRGEVTVSDGCATVPPLARDLVKDLISIGARIARSSSVAASP
jgi:hypothetical protein